MQIMRNWEFWRIAIPSLISLIVPFITYRLITRKMADYKLQLNKDLEGYKHELQSSFQTRFYEFQTRYSLLHQKKAEAIEKLYSLLVRVHKDLRTWVNSEALRQPTS